MRSALYNADRAMRTLTRRTQSVGSGAVFTVWKFDSGRSHVRVNHQRWKKKAQGAEPESSTDKFILKRPIINFNEKLFGVTDAGRLKAVLTELNALAQPSILNHPNVVDILGFIWDTQVTGGNSIAPSLILEVAHLGSLGSFQKPDFLMLSVDMKLEIVQDFANGLAALHDAGIVHGDLKAGSAYLPSHYACAYHWFSIYCLFHHPNYRYE